MAKPKTLSSEIQRHQDMMRHGQHLIHESVRFQKAEADAYRRIRNALLAPEMKGKALVDQATKQVYFLNGLGVVANLEWAWADNVPLEQDESEEDCAVSLGETS